LHRLVPVGKTEAVEIGDLAVAGDQEHPTRDAFFLHRALHQEIQSPEPLLGKTDGCRGGAGKCVTRGEGRKKAHGQEEDSGGGAEKSPAELRLRSAAAGWICETVRSHGSSFPPVALFGLGAVKSPPLTKGDLGEFALRRRRHSVATWVKSPPTPLLQRGEVLC
jgi:hypothetical protein